MGQTRPSATSTIASHLPDHVHHASLTTSFFSQITKMAPDSNKLIDWPSGPSWSMISGIRLFGLNAIKCGATVRRLRLLIANYTRGLIFERNRNFSAIGWPSYIDQSSQILLHKLHIIYSAEPTFTRACCLFRSGYTNAPLYQETSCFTPEHNSPAFRTTAKAIVYAANRLDLVAATMDLTSNS